MAEDSFSESFGQTSCLNRFQSIDSTFENKISSSRLSSSASRLERSSSGGSIFDFMMTCRSYKSLGAVLISLVRHCIFEKARACSSKARTLILSLKA